tara:strand:+ start:337 stop:1230 length:894 start_codon:yes stop_codon:yes gene_type:complete
MALETATYISQLVNTNPTASDPVSQGDDHLRLIKAVLQTQFTTLGAAAVTTTAAELNLLDGKTAVGDASGPGSSTNNAIARFDGTGGKTLQNSATTISDDGDIVVGGTTPTVTIGDGGAEDTMLVFDGAAADFRVGLDDGNDQLEIGVGSAHGTTAGITMDTAADMTLGGYINFGDEQAIRPEMKDYAETVNAIGATGGGSQSIDLTAGNVVTATQTVSATTYTFDNPSATGKSCSFTLILTNGASNSGTVWPGAVDWAGGTEPTLTSSGIDVLTFFTLDAGTIWYGFAGGLDMKSP